MIHVGLLDGLNFAVGIANMDRSQICFLKGFVFYKKKNPTFSMCKANNICESTSKVWRKDFLYETSFVVARVLMGKIRLKFLCQELFSRYWSLAYHQMKLTNFTEFYLIFSGSISINSKHPFLTIFNNLRSINFF